MTDVVRIRDELSAILDLVRTSGGPSDTVAAEAIAAKALLLSAASYFERSICDVIVRSAKESGTRHAYCNFIDKQALERRYHAMFDWDKKNINKFFGLFGSDTRDRLAEAVLADNMGDVVKDFLYIGSQRNLLVHENFAGYSLETTFNEVFERYESAFQLVEWLHSKLMLEAARDETADA